jgi:competence protein ComEC
MSISSLIIIYLIHFLFSFASNIATGEPGTGLSIKILDVGQGDAILITTPNDKKILIDGGGNYDVDSYLNNGMPLEPCVLDMVILTHLHDDHSFGLHRVLKRCTVRVISSNLTGFIDAATKAKPIIKTLVRGDNFVIDGVSFYVLWPPVDYTNKDLNDTSIVIMLDYKDYEVLLSGDAGGRILCSLDNLETLNKHLDLYKVSHHGSITGLCNKLLPKVSVISVGENKFGHPDDRVIKFLESVDSKVKRTDLEGTIEIKTNGL